MSPFLNDWYACFIQITTIWYIMTFISNPRILTSRSWLTHIKVWEKFGSFCFLLNCRDGTICVSHFQSKNFKTWLKQGGQCTKSKFTLWGAGRWLWGSHTDTSEACLQSKCRLTIWQNLLHEKVLHIILHSRWRKTPWKF